MQDNQENRAKFAVLLGKLCVAFRVDSNVEMINVYFEFLSDRSMYQVESAICDLIRSGERFPVLSKIREVAGSYREFKTVEKIPASHQITEFTDDEINRFGGENMADAFFDEMLKKGEVI